MHDRFEEAGWFKFAATLFAAAVLAPVLAVALWVALFPLSLVLAPAFAGALAPLALMVGGDPPA